MPQTGKQSSPEMQDCDKCLAPCNQLMVPSFVWSHRGPTPLNFVAVSKRPPQQELLDVLSCPPDQSVVKMMLDRVDAASLSMHLGAPVCPSLQTGSREKGSVTILLAGTAPFTANARSSKESLLSQTHDSSHFQVALTSSTSTSSEPRKAPDHVSPWPAPQGSLPSRTIVSMKSNLDTPQATADKGRADATTRSQSVPPATTQQVAFKSTSWLTCLCREHERSRRNGVSDALNIW